MRGGTVSRWDLQITLIATNPVQDENGAWVDGEPIETKVFANRLTLGTSTWLAAASAGLHADASIQVKTAEYTGQDAVILDGLEYTIEKSQNAGEYTTLTLARRLRNG